MQTTSNHNKFLLIRIRRLYLSFNLCPKLCDLYPGPEIRWRIQKQVVERAVAVRLSIHLPVCQPVDQTRSRQLAGIDW
jgi:hypothetical protein